MAKKKETEPIEVDFDLVFKEIKEPEEIRLCNIYRELGFGKNNYQFKFDESKCFWDRNKYFEYLRWLKQQGYSEWDFRF